MKLITLASATEFQYTVLPHLMRSHAHVHKRTEQCYSIQTELLKSYMLMEKGFGLQCLTSRNTLQVGRKPWDGSIQCDFCLLCHQTQTSKGPHNLLIFRRPKLARVARALTFQHSNPVSVNFRLTSPGDLAGCQLYVAVSYSWKRSPERVLNLDASSKYFVETSAGICVGKAPVDVIDRAVAFAASHDLSLLWIDQEVIDQEDATDKSQGIQVMDIAYERSLWPIAILDTTIVSQDKFDVLDLILNDAGISEGSDKEVEEDDEDVEDEGVEDEDVEDEDAEEEVDEEEVDEYVDQSHESAGTFKCRSVFHQVVDLARIASCP